MAFAVNGGPLTCERLNMSLPTCCIRCAAVPGSCGGQQKQKLSVCRSWNISDEISTIEHQSRQEAQLYALCRLQWPEVQIVPKSQRSDPCSSNGDWAVAINWEPIVQVLAIRALLFGVYTRALIFGNSHLWLKCHELGSTFKRLSSLLERTADAL